MYDYTYFDTERNCLKSKLELMRYHLDLPYILQGVMINVSKTGNTKSFPTGEFPVMAETTRKPAASTH